MPEGPSIVILRELMQPYAGRKLVRASSAAAAVDPARLRGQKVAAFRSWGKHLLIEFPDFTLRVHGRRSFFCERCQPLYR